MPLTFSAESQLLAAMVGGGAAVPGSVPLQNPVMADQYDAVRERTLELRRYQQHRRCSGIGMASTFAARERAGFDRRMGERGVGQGPTRIDAALRAQIVRGAAPVPSFSREAQSPSLQIWA